MHLFEILKKFWDEHMVPFPAWGAVPTTGGGVPGRSPLHYQVMVWIYKIDLRKGLEKIGVC
jgi:hypothetical protein